MVLAAVGWLSPVGAAAVQSAAVVAVAVNSARLLRALETAPPRGTDGSKASATRGRRRARGAKKDAAP